MAMIRTIQHPGIQIQENEIGGYTSTIVMNNAYIMGYTDRGPIYDYSWIMNTREFTKIYGEPQTEAEKYLFTAVQSVLANGGTPIVARMPYDNKQCKAYKALKMKWGDVTPLVDTDLTSPVVPLSAMAGDLNMDKSFKEIFSTNTVTINDEFVTQDFIDNLTFADVVKQLNPFKSGSEGANGIKHKGFIKGFKLNGVYPSALNIDQGAINSLLDSLELDKTKLLYKAYNYDEGYNKTLTNSHHFINDNASTAYLATIRDKYFQISDSELKVSGLINIFGTSTELPEDFKFDKDLSGYTVYLPDQLDEQIITALSSFCDKKNCDLSSFLGEVTNDGAVGDNVPYLINGDIDIGRVCFKTPSYSGDNNIVKIPYYFENDALSTYIKNGDVVGYISYLNSAGESIGTDLSGGFSVVTKYEGNQIFTDTNFKPISNYVDFAKNQLNSELKLYQIDFNKLKRIFKDDLKRVNIDGLIADVVGCCLDDKSEYLSSYIFLDQLIPIYKNTINGFKCDPTYGTLKSDSPFYEPADIIGDPDYSLYGFLNRDVESVAVTGYIRVPYKLENGTLTGKIYPVWNETQLSGLTWDTTGIGVLGSDDYVAPSAIHYFDDDIPKNKFGALNWNNYRSIIYSGDVNTATCKNIYYTGYLNDVPIVKVYDEIIAENEVLVSIKTIFNSAKFLKHSQTNEARLDAALMMTPEMGFKYGLYLDSEDCEISNDQYDDLVTVNQFKAVDRTIDKYGHDIDDANFIIVDKQKTVVQGAGGNIGYFTTVIDPFDALKVQRLLVNPAEHISSSRNVYRRDEAGNITKTIKVEFDHSDANIGRIDYWAYEAADSWNQIYDQLLDSMDCLQRVRNADGIYIGEPNPIDGKLNILDSWAVPLTGTYYEESISKILMRKFPGISMADLDSSAFDNEDYAPSIIDHQFATHILVAVCKTTIDQGTGKIVVSLIETFFGSLFNEKSIQNGRSLFIGDIINGNSDYIEFYRNNYVSAGDAGAYDPPEYRRTDVNQIFIQESEDLKNAAQLRGIDADDYALDSADPAIREAGMNNYLKDLAKKHIYVIDKKDVCVYNLHWEANLTSFSKKESQKIIANTSGLYSINDGTTINVAKNFLVDMDRCINFIKNKDDLPLHFVCDAGLSTIAQFCDNVVWNPNKMTVVGEAIDAYGRKTGKKIYEQTGGWITQPFSPDDDPDGEDRYITDYSDVATWRKVAEKIDSICSDTRKDCFAIIDAPRNLTLDGAAPKIRRSKFNNNFDKTIGKALRYISGFNSSYSAGYYNWLRTIDQYTGKAIWIPPTSKIIGNYCYLNINNLPWLAPAGLTYGLISGCHAISHNPDYQEEDQIYIKSWNYIKQYPVEGFVIEGQKTLLGKESVFDRVNVRLLFLDLERFAYNVSRTFKYQVNNTYTREQFIATLKPKFEDYTLRGGIYEYLIKCDSENNTPETIDANELRADFFIKPARLIEYILLSFTGTSTGTDFNELPMG